MIIQGFHKEDFDTFHIEGLDERMNAIQSRIQPKFQEIGEELVNFLSANLGNEVYLHIAKHARRTVNPPKDTWLAIADNKRGYKKHPHFQLGLFDDHLFIWLAFIYELPNKKEIAETLLDNYEELTGLPNDFMISLDHTQKEAISLGDLERKHLERFRDVKKGEFLIGRHLPKEDERVQNGDRIIDIAKETYTALLPYYQKALSVR